MALDTNSNSNINVSSCTSFIESTDGRADQASSCNNTPRTARRCSAKSTPMRALSRTPSSTTKTPTSGDRFIPAIDDNLDIAHFYLSQDERHYSTQETERPIASNYVSTLEDTIFEGRTQSKILSFKAKAPKPQTIRDTTNLYYATEPRRTSPKKRHRHIPSAPDKILDAPELADDYYLNVLAWGSNNVLAVGLGNTVYLLNATTSKITQLPNQDAITSLAWHSSSNYLAVGTNAGTVQIWDTEKEKRLREMRGHLCRVGVVDWADYVLSSGSRDTNIFHHDVRVQNHHISTFSGHSQEVCGLKWNSGHTLLASGANDNQANIWDIRNTRQRTNTPTTPLYTLPHFAAVKALAWCPFQSHLLATGGGTNDRQIHFWSSSTGSCLNSIDTKAQVCQLLWSTNYKEIVSSHGFSQNNLTVWSYPSMSKVADLSGHTSRVLYLAMSPDGETVVSGAGDETLRFWKVFEKERKALSLPKHTPSQIYGINTMIR